MRYCLRCCDICSDTSEEYELCPESCGTCGATGEMLKEDGVTGEQYEQMTEDEKDEYEVKIRLEVENSPYFNEELYRKYSMGDPDFYYNFRYDEYTRLTGKKAGQKLTPEEEAEEKRKFEESMRGAEADYYFNLGKQKREEQENANKPKCPICNSTNLSKLSNVSKVAKVGLFGIFGAGDLGKTWKCNNCGSKF